MNNQKKLQNLAILTLDPSNGGGVLHSLLAAHKILSKHFKIKVFHASFDPEISTSIKRLKLYATIKPYKKYGLDFVAVGVRWAFYEPGHHRFNLNLWRKALDGFDNFFVTSGTAIAAHPLALLEKKYCLWIATTFASERPNSLQYNPFRRLLEKLTFGQMLKIEKSILTKANSVLAMSSQTAKEINKICPEIKPRIVGFPIEQSNSQEKTPTTSEKRFDAIAIARWADPRKNLPFLLTAWQKVCQSKPDSILALVGSEPEFIDDKTKKLFDVLVKKSSIKCFFNVGPEEKKALLKESKMLLISSKQEGLGITGIEAGLYAKIPVISTNCGGPADYVIENKTGFLVSYPNQMAQRILDFLSNEDLSQKMGLALEKSIKTKFSQCTAEREFLRGLSNHVSV